jgi:hypothetical protein
MFTRIDHITIYVPDLQQGMAQFSKMGFNIETGDVHPDRGTHHAVAFNDEDYIELSAICDQAGYQAAAKAGSADAGLADCTATGGGLRSIMIQSDDLAADVAAMRSRGIDVSDAIVGGRRVPAGPEWRWKAAALGPGNALPIVFIQHLTSLRERRNAAGVAGAHPNGVYGLERAYIVTEDVETAAATYAKVLGVPPPPLQKGTVIMSNMAIFQIGSTGLGVVEPYAAGPAAEVLERSGPGPFQALYRTRSMGAAARWMQGHGMPPLARGVRNTGEQAMLATPREACGAYIGFVGPE